MNTPLRYLVLASAGALLLSGCVRVQADTSIGADDTFSQHVIFAFSDTVADQVGQEAGVDVNELTDSLAQSEAFEDLEAKYPDQIVIADYADEDLNGIELTMTDLPLSEFNGAASEATASLGATASIERVDDTFVVTMAAPDSAEPDADADAGETPDGIDGMNLPDLDSLGLSGGNLSLIANSIDFEVSYTFPGLVTEASAGTINGNTVTLDLTDVTAGSEIRLVGGASPEMDWWPIIKWAAIIAAFASVIGGAALLVRQDKRRRSSNSLPPPAPYDDGNRNDGVGTGLDTPPTQP